MPFRWGDPDPEAITLHPVTPAPRWLPLFAAWCAGVAVGLVIAVAVIPDQPDRIIVPVDRTPVTAPEVTA